LTNRRKGIAFLVLSAVFLAIGAGGRPKLLGVGTAFLAAGIYFLIRSRRET
jgi:hypothetical protein